MRNNSLLLMGILRGIVVALLDIRTRILKKILNN